MSRIAVALIVAVVALAASITANVVAFTRTPNLADGSVQLADLSPEVLAANIRGPQGLRGERGKTGARGRRGLHGEAGLPGPTGEPGADYGAEVDDLDSRVSDVEFKVDEVCSTLVVTGYAFDSRLEQVFLC
jgi:Collagen triple helix repeat (20 copies)